MVINSGSNFFLHISDFQFDEGYNYNASRSATKIGTNVWSMETGATPLMETGATPLQESNAFQVTIILIKTMTMKMTMMIMQMDLSMKRASLRLVKIS